MWQYILCFCFCLFTDYVLVFVAEYMKATRILQVLGFVGLVVAVAVAIYANCRRRYVGRSFSLEVITGLSGKETHAHTERWGYQFYANCWCQYPLSLSSPDVVPSG